MEGEPKYFVGELTLESNVGYSIFLNKFYPNVHTLNLVQNDYIYERQLMKICLEYKKLRKLKIDGCALIDGKELKTLDLDVLEIHENDDLTDESIGVLKTNQLTLSEISQLKGDPRTFPLQERVRILKLRGNPKLRDHVLLAFPNVEKLVVEECDGVVKGFKELKKLRELHIYFSDVLSKNLGSKTVSVLSLSKCPKLRGDYLEFFPNLKEFRVSFMSVEGLTKESAAIVEKLEKIVMTGCYFGFPEMKNLRELIVQECDIFFIDLCPVLKKLVIRNCKSLYRIDARNCEDLSISDCNKVEDKFLKNMKNLRKLHLHNCARMDGSFFEHLFNLEHCQLEYCQDVLYKKGFLTKSKKLKMLEIKKMEKFLVPEEEYKDEYCCVVEKTIGKDVVTRRYKRL